MCHNTRNRPRRLGKEVFDISSPNEAHTSIVFAERLAGKITKAKDTYPTDPANEVTAHNITANVITASKGDTWESSPPLPCHNLPMILAHASMECKCNASDCILMLRFPEDSGLMAHKLATLLVKISALEPEYHLMNTQCYWFVATVFQACKCLFPCVKQETTKSIAGTWFEVGILTKPSLDATCTSYEAVQSVLEVKIEEQRRQQEETVQRKWQQDEAADK
ncbi:hypothetical protein EDD15DRAFT_2202246 [Pisolithus albus]|nr:hypothetical protein EDD15DRAFT_2202245 [Pisolithus albus]KAI5983259.1 hypothetical protein EDD15DRAFT_2202246 [Pisolithus albus]